MDLHVETSGGGPDLVLLHGWGMNAAVWDDMTTQLTPRFRVHRVDLPGHGFSAACKPYTADGMADALTAALPRRASVCGWSLGGQVALNWALRHPAQIERLVLIATTPRFVRDAKWECGICAGVLEAFVQSLARDYWGTLQRFVTLQAQGDADMRTVRRRLRGKLLEHGTPDLVALTAGLRLLQETDLRGRLAHVMQPALIVHGECDTLAPSAAGAYLQRTLPRAVLKTIAGAAHAPFIAQPRRVARHITEFCGGK